MVEPAILSAIRDLIRIQSGVLITIDKLAAMSSRLERVACRYGLSSPSELPERLQQEQRGELLQNVVEALASQETPFFRDWHPFEALRKYIFPSLIETRRTEQRLSIWCASNSAGQETYSIAMVLYEYFPELANWDISFLATGISREIVQRAEAGWYTSEEAAHGVPEPFLARYFDREQSLWRIKKEIRERITFQQMNPARDWPDLKNAGLVFMRNLLTYYDMDTKRTVLGRLRETLAPDGYLFLGAAESTRNLDKAFEPILASNATCYRLSRQEEP